MSINKQKYIQWENDLVYHRLGGNAVPGTAFIFTNYRCSIIGKLTLLVVVCVLRLSGWTQSAGSWVCSILGNCKGISSPLSQHLCHVFEVSTLFLKCTDRFHEKKWGCHVPSTLSFRVMLRCGRRFHQLWAAGSFHVNSPYLYALFLGVLSFACSFVSLVFVHQL